MAALDEFFEVDWLDVFFRSILFLIYAAGACVIGFIFYVGWLELTSGSTEYTVTITSVDGLDPAALEQRGDLAALSPVFDLAVHIDNTLYKVDERCIGRHSSAVVSYRDAVLGKGTVPEFCAKALGAGETTATAWGMDVQMPRFLRNRLAGELDRGEAVLDVAVRAPGSGSCSLHDCMEDLGDVAVRTPRSASCYIYRCMDLLLDCKVRIGGGPSPPCLVTDVDPRSTATKSFKRCKAKIGGGPSPPCLVTDVDPRSTATKSLKR